MRFGIIGAAGYVAPRHMLAIVENGGEIVTACDISDSVGVLDSFAPRCRFTSLPRQWWEKELDDVDVVVVCTPNYVHQSQMILATRQGCDVVLEKPIHTNGGLMAEPFSGYHGYHGKPVRVYPVLQLRYHPLVAQRIWEFHSPGVSYFDDVQIQYEVYRGPWYDASWKGDEARSGGLLVNLGVHLFDLCCHMFGKPLEIGHSAIEQHRAGGTIQFERASVTWGLRSDAPTPRRLFSVNGYEINLTSSMGQLHGEFYRRLMAGEPMPTLAEASKALTLIDAIKEVAL